MYRDKRRTGRGLEVLRKAQRGGLVCLSVIRGIAGELRPFEPTAIVCDWPEQ